MEEVDCFSYMFCQLHDFMRKGLFTDVIFVVGNTTARAHKVILASSSSVFRTMFEASNEDPPSPQTRCFQKKKKREVDSYYSNVIVIKDTDADCFVAFLDYLYCRDKKIVQSRAKEMIVLAHKYKIQHLLPLCDSFIQGSLTNETAAECLLLADQCERFDLKKIIKSYIKSQLEFIMASETWQLLESKFELTTEIIEWDSKEYYVERERMDEVTWTLCSDAWKDEKKEDITETRGVIISPIIAGEPNIGVFLSFYCRNNSLVVVGYSDYCFRKSFPLTFAASVKDMKTSQVVMEKKVHVEWKPTETDGNEIMTLAESLDFHFQYPLMLRVSVQKTPAISQHPCVRSFNFYEIRKRFTDVVIRVNKSDFQLHKLVLASKSEYFAKLFESDLGTYDFTDTDVSSFTCLLNYMYSCIFPPPASVDLRLLEGAQKYNLAELSEYCITILIINLGVTNVVEIYTQADNMGIDQLKSAAVDFIANNREKVVKSIDWKNMKDYPHLLKELLSKISLNERDELDVLLPKVRR